METASPFILPAGVTGFGDHRSLPEPHGLLKQLKTLAHRIMRETHGQVMSCDEGSLAGRSFHTLLAKERSGEYSILLNAFFPLLGFSEPLRENNCPLIFREVPAAFASQEISPFVLLDAPTLNSVPDEQVISELTPAEREQLRYFRPQRTGEIIFNCWD